MDAAIDDGVNILILSDRGVKPEQAAIPALLAVAGLHHHLIRNGKRTQVTLILESGEPREVHHFAVLIGYGASAINPYLALRDDRGHDRRGHAGRRGPGDRRLQLSQGPDQGRGQDHLEDGHLDHPELLRRADLRGDGPEAILRGQLLHLDADAHGRDRHRRSGGRGRAPASQGVPGALSQRSCAARGRRLPVATGRGTPSVQPADHSLPAAGRAHQRL